MGSEATLRHRVTVRRMGEGVNFQVDLPRPTRNLTGVRLVASPGPSARAAAMAGRWRLSQAGTFSLRWAAPGDIFLQWPVALDLGHDAAHSPAGVAYPDHALAAWREEFWVSGTRHGAIPVAGGGDGHTLKGYYKDSINLLSGADEEYTVDLYVHYRDEP